MRTPRYNKAAWDQANKTLFGAWSTFKDFIRMGSANMQGGMFGGMLGVLQRINKALIPAASTKKGITMGNVAEAVDQAITPRSHAVMNFFITFEYALKTLIGTFLFLGKAISTAMWPFDKFFNMFGMAHQSARILGIAIGALTVLFLINKGAVFLDTLAYEAWEATMYGVKYMIITLGWLYKVLTGDIKLSTLATQYSAWVDRQKAAAAGADATATDIQAASNKSFARILFGQMLPALGRTIVALWALFVATIAESVAWNLLVNAWQKGGIMAFLDAFATIITEMVIPALVEATTAAWGFIAAWAVALWPLALFLAVAYVLTLLYMRWKAFHDLVNNTARYLWQNWKYVAMILIVLGGPIGLMIGETGTIAKYWNTIVGYLKAVYNWIVKIWEVMGRPFKGWFSAVAHAAGAVGHAFGVAAHVTTHAGSYLNPTGGYWGGGHAIGGTIGGPQMAIVGERGPEIVRLPGGANITPNPPVSALNWGGMNGNDRPIIVQLVVDRKVLAQSVARANQDYASRR
jgi:hypothetical protein